MDDDVSALVRQLKSEGKAVICYFSAGSYENWRTDAKQFPASVLGNDYEGWAGEKWLDIRKISVLAPIMTARMRRAKQMGCDGVDPDNVEGYTIKTGFPLTKQDQLAYNKWIAKTAHSLGLAVGLKNGASMATDLQPHFDFVVAEECVQYNFCTQFSPFYQNQKSVVDLEYTVSQSTMCTKANSVRGINFLKKNLNLDSMRQNCATELKPTQGFKCRCYASDGLTSLGVIDSTDSCDGAGNGNGNANSNPQVDNGNANPQVDNNANDNGNDNSPVVCTPAGQSSGVCLDKTVNSCDGGQFFRGVCPGSASVQCCVKNSVNPPPQNPPPQNPPPQENQCTPSGIQETGICQDYTLPCDGQYYRGACPGASNIRCCVKNSGGNPNPPPPVTPSAGGWGTYQAPSSARNYLGNLFSSVSPRKTSWGYKGAKATFVLPGGEIYFESKMDSDCDGSPTCPSIDATGQTKTSYTWKGAPVDALKANYFVLPSNLKGRLGSTRLGLGDIAAVIYNGKLEFAIYADNGPNDKIGEGSIQLVQNLGFNPYKNGRICCGISSGVVVLVFPGSRGSYTSPYDRTSVRQAGLAKLNALTGMKEKGKEKGKNKKEKGKEKKKGKKGKEKEKKKKEKKEKEKKKKKEKRKKKEKGRRRGRKRGRRRRGRRRRGRGRRRRRSGRRIRRGRGRRRRRKRGRKRRRKGEGEGKGEREEGKEERKGEEGEVGGE